jgi:DNA-directed RNA polymerase subunit E'/Rpb7
MPEDMSFDAKSGDCWVSEDETVEIREGSVVRLRIIGLTIDADVIVSAQDIYLCHDMLLFILANV